jgi:hypothetical protein
MFDIRKPLARYGAIWGRARSRLAGPESPLASVMPFR